MHFLKKLVQEIFFVFDLQTEKLRFLLHYDKEISEIAACCITEKISSFVLFRLPYCIFSYTEVKNRLLCFGETEICSLRIERGISLQSMPPTDIVS